MLSSITHANPIIFQRFEPTRATSESQGQTDNHQSEYIDLPDVDHFDQLRTQAVFYDIKDQFLSDIKEMKQLAHPFVGDQYDQKVDIFYKKLKSPSEDLFDSLLPVYRETRFQIHQLVQQLKTQQNDPNADNKDYITGILHNCLESIELCLAAVHSRFNECFFNSEALQERLVGKLFKIRSELFKQFIQSFLFEQQRKGGISVPQSMEIHFSNGLHNLFCDFIGLSPIADQFAPRNLADHLSERFQSAAQLTINACTILRKLSSDWSDLFSATLQKIGVQAWETEAIDLSALTVDRTNQLDSGFFLPVNNLLKIKEELPLNLWSMIEETGDGRYHLGRYREKLQAWVFSQFCESTAKVFTTIGAVDSSLHIGTIDNRFFWVFDREEQLPKGQPFNFVTDNHTTLTLSHLTSVDFSTWPKETAYALLTQAMEQTDNAEHIASFFLQQATINQLRKVPELLVKTLSNQLSEKLTKNDGSFKDKLCQGVYDHFVADQTAMAEDSLDWLHNTPLLKPVLLKLQQAMDVSPTVQNLASWQISDFSHDEIKKLLSPESCQRLFKQAFKLKQAELLSNLLLTAHCNELASSLSGQQENPLILFARGGNLAGLNYLLKLDSSAINKKDEFGYTPLGAAARYGHLECVKALLNVSGVVVNKRQFDFRLPLAAAAFNGHLECIRELLKVEGIDVNNKEKGGWTPLNTAAFYGHLECIRELLKAEGIDVNEKNVQGYTPLNTASQQGHLECVKALLNARGIDVNEKNVQGYTPLITASQQGHLECVKALLNARGIDVNEKNVQGYTPLITASQQGHLECVKALLNARGIDVNEADMDGRTPLITAIQQGHLECVKALLNARGIDVNKKCKSDWAPLNLAAFKGRLECIRELLKAKGIDVNMPNYSGATPLSTAACYGFVKCVKELLKAEGIDVNRKCQFDSTPLSVAAKEGTSECIRELLKVEGIDVNNKEKGGWTPLNNAACYGHLECIRELLTAEVIDVNEKNSDGYTPLSNAAKEGNADCVSELLKAQNINVNKSTKKKETPLMLAIEYYYRTLENKHQSSEDGSLCSEDGSYVQKMGLYEDGSEDGSLSSEDGSLSSEDEYPSLEASYLADEDEYLSLEARYLAEDEYETVGDKHLECAMHLINDSRTDLNAVSLSQETALSMARKYQVNNIITLLEDKLGLKQTSGSNGEGAKALMR